MISNVKAVAATAPSGKRPCLELERPPGSQTLRNNHQ